MLCFVTEVQGRFLGGLFGGGQNNQFNNNQNNQFNNHQSNQNTGLFGGPATIGGGQVAGHRLPHAQNNLGNAVSGVGLGVGGLGSLFHLVQGGEVKIRPSVGLGFNTQTGQLAPNLGLTTSVSDNH